MKKIAVFVLALSSFAAHGQSVHVRYNTRDVAVSVWNRTNYELRCSGPLRIYTADNRVQTLNIFLPVRPQGTMTRTLRPYTAAPINRVSHSIWCR